MHVTVLVSCCLRHAQHFQKLIVEERDPLCILRDNSDMHKCLRSRDLLGTIPETSQSSTNWASRHFATFRVFMLTLTFLFLDFTSRKFEIRKWHQCFGRTTVPYTDSQLYYMCSTRIYTLPISYSTVLYFKIDKSIQYIHLGHIAAHYDPDTTENKCVNDCCWDHLVEDDCVMAPHRSLKRVMIFALRRETGLRKEEKEEEARKYVQPRRNQVTSTRYRHRLLLARPTLPSHSIQCRWNHVQKMH